MCELTTSATVGNRGVSLQFRNWNGRRFLVAGTAALQSESDTTAFVWQSAAGAGVWEVDDAVLAGIPSLMLLPLCTVTIHVSNMQPGDQLSDVALALDVYPPRDVEAGEVAFPLLEALQELNVQGIQDELRELKEAMLGVTAAVGGMQRESERARFQREVLAARAG